MLLKPSGGGFFSGELSLPPNEWLSRAALGRSEENRKLSDLLNREGGPSLLMEQFSNPLATGRTAIVLATRSEGDDQAYFTRLREEARQGNISGGLVLADDKQFHSFRLASNSYTLGPAASSAAIYSTLRFYLWLVPVLLMVSSVVIGRWWEQYLEQQAQKRLSIAE